MQDLTKIDSITVEEMQQLWGNKWQIYGKDENFLKSEENRLQSENNTENINELTDVRSQLGKDPTGKRKNKCCWTYIKNGKQEYLEFIEFIPSDSMRISIRLDMNFKIKLVVFRFQSKDLHRVN